MQYADDADTMMMTSNDTTLDSAKRCLFPDYDDETCNGSVMVETEEDEDEDDHDDLANDPQTSTSPTSVVNALHDDPSKSSTTIVMGDEGAEVALHDLTNMPLMSGSTQREKHDNSTGPSSSNMSSNSLRDPFRTVRTSSLLDVETTPRRSPRTPVCATPSTTNCIDCDAINGHKYLERTITTFLEDSFNAPESLQTACTDWQAWSLFGFGSPMKEASVHESPSKEHIRSLLRHRASLSVRQRRLAVRRIRKQLAPFSNSPARSPARAFPLFRSLSFSVSDHRSAIVRQSKDSKQVPSRNSFTNVLQLCTMPENTTLDSPEFVKLKPSSYYDYSYGSSIREDSNDACYDSDPEDFTRRYRISNSKSQSSENSGDSSSTSEYNFPDVSYSPSRPWMDIHNDDVFSTIVQEIFNQTTTLVLHTSSSKTQSATHNTAMTTSRPVAIEAWLERGQNLALSLIQPKWMWKLKTRGTGTACGIQNTPLNGIELLDVTRILKAENANASYPFVKPNHCFIVKSIHNEEFCFEASNVHERDRLVYCLKLVIARFGAKVLVGDPGVYWEFFYMVQATVPGAAPDLDRLGDYEEYDDETSGGDD